MATYIDAVKQLLELLKLPKGWDYGHGGPISKATVIAAANVVNHLHNLGVTDFDIVPGQEAAVVIFGYKDDSSVEIQAFPNGKFDFLFEKGDVEGEIVDDLNFAELRNKLEGCGWKSLRLFVSCTQGAMWNGRVDSLGLPSRIPPMAAGFRSSAPVVLRKPETTYVRTLASSTTKEFLDHRQYSGEYKEVSCPLALA